MMVSLRRKKLKEMVEGAKRRSARLLALEEVKNERAVLALPVDFLQRTINGPTCLRKRGRKKNKELDVEAHRSQEVELTIEENLAANSSASRKTDRIIGYILDMLEVKDTHELFSMPGNLQTYDYEESMRQPGDFATLRQKYTDKMYATFEQFENDVLTVFNKAIDVNPPDSIPFREAMTQRDHAKQIFQSLKNNPTYAELELSAWHQRYFKYTRRAWRNAASRIGTSNAATQPEYGFSPGSSAGTKQHTKTDSASHRRLSQSASRSKPRSRKALVEENSPQPCEEQRRFTYTVGNGSNESMFTMFCNEPKSCVYSKNTLSYIESLRRFVKDAGPMAKQVAENKCVEYSKRVEAMSIWRPSPFGSQSTIGGHGISFPSPQAQPSGTPNPLLSKDNETSSTSHVIVQPPSNASDELLSLFCNIGTPEFINQSLALTSNQYLDSKLGFSSFLQGSGAIQSSVKPVKQTSQCSDFESSVWQPRLGGSKPWKEKEPAGYVFSEKESSSSATAALRQNHTYNFPLRHPSMNKFRGIN